MHSLAVISPSRSKSSHKVQRGKDELQSEIHGLSNYTLGTHQSSKVVTYRRKQYVHNHTTCTCVYCTSPVVMFTPS